MTKTTISPQAARIKRGIKLYRERGDQIERLTANVYAVPSCSGGRSYVVDTALGHCTCPDHERAKALGVACKHRVAAEIVQAKRRAARNRVAVA